MKKLIVVLTILGGMLVFADAKSDFDGAIQMIKDNNIPTAVKSLEKLSKGKDKEYSAKANFVLGDYWASQNDLVKAESYYKLVVGDRSKVDNDVIAAAFQLGNIYYAQKQNDKAADYFEWVNTATGDKNPRALEVLGTFYFRTGKESLAETKFLKAAEVDPKDIPVRLILVEFYELKGNTTSANKYFQEIKKIEPKFRYLDMGIYFTQNGNPELAEKYLKKSQQIEKDAYADYVLGIVYYNQNKIEDARKMFQSASNKGVEDAKKALDELNTASPAPATPTKTTPTKKSKK
ncbi:MAG: tetratricopeptide repeat protein [Sebaldella sp.]|nr:tetratricopeptide repeat protein [Sebaldella sp.]